MRPFPNREARHQIRLTRLLPYWNSSHLMRLSLCRRNITELHGNYWNMLEQSSNGQALPRPCLYMFAVKVM